MIGFKKLNGIIFSGFEIFTKRVIRVIGIVKSKGIRSPVSNVISSNRFNTILLDELILILHFKDTLFE